MTIRAGSSPRACARGLPRQQIPMFPGVLDDCRHVVGEEVAVLYERCRRLLHELQILFARGIAFFDREARIASLLAFDLRARERGVSAPQWEELLGPANRSVSEIPSC